MISLCHSVFPVVKISSGEALEKNKTRKRGEDSTEKRNCWVIGAVITDYRLLSTGYSVLASTGYGVLVSNSLPTLSSTPFTKCTDSGEENFRAISSASLITTAFGVSG